MAEPEGKHWGLGLTQSKQKSTARFQQAVVTLVGEGAFIRWEPVGGYRPHPRPSFSVHLSILQPCTLTQLHFKLLLNHHTTHQSLIII